MTDVLTAPETEEVLVQSEVAPDKSAEEVSIEQLREELKTEIVKKLEEQDCSKAMLDEWKAHFGPLGFMPIGDQIYVIRSLLRKEWKEMNKQWAARANSESPPTQFDTEEEITAKATLWPKFTIIDLRNTMPAGVASTLSEAISTHAGFVPNAAPIVF